MSEPLAPGDHVVLVDAKRRRYMIVLAPGGRFHSHSGFIPHDQLIGALDGASIKASNGSRYDVTRPSLSDRVVLMPRGAQVIYPKDLSAILMAADIYQGARVLEAGVGSGALSMALLRAGADVVGYEIRPDFASRAAANVADFIGADAHYEIRLNDIYEGIDERDLDRVLLDLPEPWRVVPHAQAALRPGGILLSYLPTINQVATLHEALNHSSFGIAETFEVLWRTWHIDGASVRPDHRMVAHTGFITHARLLHDTSPS